MKRRLLHKLPELCYWLYSVCPILILSLCFPSLLYGQNQATFFTLDDAIQAALKANLELKVSQEAVNEAGFEEAASGTALYPTFSTRYQYKLNDEELRRPGVGVFQPKDEYGFYISANQPIFKGFAIINEQKIAKLNLMNSQLKEALTQQDIVLATKQTFFSILRSQKLLDVSLKSVKLLEALRTVAKNFYEVGMTPRNDFLKAEVELANANQDVVIRKNNLAIAESNFNLVLQRPVNASIQLQDVLQYSPLEYDLQYCLNTAENNRLELKVIDTEIEKREKEIDLSKKDYYPEVNLEGNYSRRGADWDVSGGEGIENYENWNLQVLASWTFFEWGKTKYNVASSRSSLRQAKYLRSQLYDQIRLEVKQAYLKTREAEENIAAVEAAITQAEENYRITQQQYQEQAATSTDVLDAETLLSRTMTRYFRALYDFQLSKASLERAMGLPFLKIEM